LGLYGIANAGISILATIPSSLGRMLIVKFAEMHGQSKTSESMVSALYQSTAVIASLFAPLIALATVFFPIAVLILLPRFVQGIAAGKLLIASVFFIGISLPATHLCISTGRFKPVVVLRLIVVVAEFVAVYIVIRHNMRLEHIAFCIFCASAVFCTAMIITCNYLFARTFRNGIYSTLNAILPFLSILSSLYIQYYIFPFENYGKGTDIMTSCIVNLVVIFVVSAPFIYVVYRRIPIFQKLIWNTLTPFYPTRNRSNR
jgi:O-antigen/teichoic acid export membrane protein